MSGNGNGGFGGREVVIVDAVRTPIGRGHEEKGYYKDVHPSNLLAKVYGELFERSGVDPAETGDVITGCAQQFGEQGVNIGRNAWLEAGLPIETPATTIDRQCGSAQQAVNFAAALIATGVHDVAIGSGVEHMGHISFADGYEVMKEHGSPFSPELIERYDLIPQGLSAEMIADRWEIPRSELVELGAGDLPPVGDHLGGEALRDQVVSLDQLGREGRAVLLHHLVAGGEGDVAHVLDAGADRDVVDAAGDQRRGEVDRLLGGATLAVDRRRRSLDRQAGLEPGVAADVDPLLAELLGAAGDHVAGLGRVDAGALEQLAVDLGQQVGGVDVLVVALLLVPAPDRRADRLDDYDLTATEPAIAVA